MRVLCSAVPLEGHVRPLLPIAQALAKAGHDVRIATGSDSHERVREAGLIPLLAGPTVDDAFALSEHDPRFADLSLTQRGGATFSQIIAPAKLPDLERITAEWRPDLIVHECTDLAAPIAAAVAGIPTVTQGWGLIPLPGLTVPDPADLVPLWHSRGLETDQYSGIFGAIHLHPMPHSLQPDPIVPRGHIQPMRLDIQAGSSPTLPAWADGLASARRPVIYASLGTHYYFSRPDFFRIILDGLANFDADVVATLGAHNAPESLGPQPDNVHLERWLPLPSLLPLCSIVICHGGSGTLLASLANGLPLLLLPRGADQFENAAAGAHAGVAQVVQPEALTSEAIADAVKHLLVDDSYRRAGARLRAELEAMPSPMAVVPLLEKLAMENHLPPDRTPLRGPPDDYGKN
jgi:UDP:flavonoid glycosyltransferase YjiC (YdhE family)